MTHTQAKALLDKTLLVISSCETEQQLLRALAYRDLVVRRLTRLPGILGAINFFLIVHTSLVMKLSQLAEVKK